MLGGIRPEIQYLKGEGENSSVWKNSNVLKDKIRILILGEIRPEFQCFER